MDIRQEMQNGARAVIIDSTVSSWERAAKVMGQGDVFTITRLENGNLRFTHHLTPADLEEISAHFHAAGQPFVLPVLHTRVYVDQVVRTNGEIHAADGYIAWTTSLADVLDRNEPVELYVEFGPAQPFIVWSDDQLLAAVMLVVIATGLLALLIRRRGRLKPG